MSDRQIVDQAGDIGDRQVVVRLAVVALEVVAVLRAGRVGLQGGGGIVQRMTPGEGVQQGQPADKALLVAGLQRVVVGVELVESLGDVAVVEGRIGVGLLSRYPPQFG